MKWLLHSRAQSIGAIVVLATMLIIGFLPLFGGPGYESSLAAGLLIPSVAAVCTAIDLVEAPRAPFEAMARGAASGVILALLGYVTTLLHGFRAGLCDPVGGTVAFVLGPGFGAVMGGTWGALVGELVTYSRRRAVRLAAAVVVAMAGPVAGIILSLWRFYTTPIIFAFDPFFGYFSGTLYDTVVDATGALVTYRLGSSLTLLAAAMLGAHLTRSEDGSIVLRNLHRPGVALLGAACGTTSLVLVLEGWRLGHWHTGTTIERELGAEVHGKRCDIIYARALRPEDVKLFARECDQQLEAVERFFESGNTGRVRAYLFANASDKRRLMGAADVLIAKPWRQEIYVQHAGYPHPGLAHELAHVVAGTFGRGPFHIAGSWGGLVPNPGLIEGVAVAASPDQEVLLPAEWSRAMLDLGLLPPLDRVFAMGFLGENSSKAYTVAGAFVGFVRDKYGAAAMQRWYRGESLAQIVKRSPIELETAFKEQIGKLPLPEPAKAVARAIFDRPAIWSRRCPHVIDRYRREAEQAAGNGDYIDAVRIYERLLKVDPHDDLARLDSAGCLLHRGDRADAVSLLAALASDEAVSRIIRNRALSQLADLDLEAGQLEAAAQRYAQLAARTLDEDALRTIELKSSATSDPRARRALTAYLIGNPVLGINPTKAGALLGTWIGEDPTDGLPEYLLARDSIHRGLYADAAERLDRALAKRLPPGKLLREALRQRVIVACALEDSVAARRVYEIWVDKGEIFHARRDALRRLVSRCVGGETRDGRATQ